MIERDNGALRPGPDRRLPIAMVVVHTTGTGIVQAARDAKRDPLDEALRRYRRVGGVFPHYVIGTSGRTVQVASEDVIAWHVGIESPQWVQYETGVWTRRVAPSALEAWQDRWPGRQSPLDLLPMDGARRARPNDVSIGVELVPTGSAKYTGPGKVYTGEQYQALAELLADIAARRGHMPVLGHEDLEPLDRWDRGGGWDPGALRADPWFDWRRVTRAVAALGAPGAGVRVSP